MCQISGFFHQPLIGGEIGKAQHGFAGLTGAEKFPGAADFQITAGNFKAVAGFTHGHQALLGGTAKQRLMTMRETSDGFEIARRDLEIRGPGEFLGARQSGEAMLRFADLATDQWLVEKARNLAQTLLKSEPAIVDAHLARWLGGREDFLKV